MLETKRFILKPASIENADEITAFYCHNRKHFKPYFPNFSEDFYTSNYQIETIKNQDNPFKHPRNVTFWVFHKNNHKLVAYTKLSEIIRGFFQNCFISYAVHKDFQNLGFATEIVKRTVGFAFEDLKLHRIEANIVAHNDASIKVVEKCGFNLEGISKKYLKINDTWQDHFRFVFMQET